jgi:hypothetical protein
LQFQKKTSKTKKTRDMKNTWFIGGLFDPNGKYPFSMCLFSFGPAHLTQMHLFRFPPENRTNGFGPNGLTQTSPQVCWGREGDQVVQET